MQASHTILVVAPDDELRRSVKFALEAEGFGVVTTSEIPDSREMTAQLPVSCAVVDDSALRSARMRPELGLDCPVVLLIDGFSPPSVAAGHILVKPLLGRSLVSAVVESLNAAPTAT